MWGHMNGYGWNMGSGMLLIWVLLGVGFALLVRYATRDDKQKSALEILEERYARGEIGHDEFEQKKHDLEQ